MSIIQSNGHKKCSSPAFIALAAAAMLLSAIGPGHATSAGNTKNVTTTSGTASTNGKAPTQSTTLSTPAKTTELAGLVVNMTGSWKLDLPGATASEPIKHGDAIPVGGLLKPASPGATISVALTNGTTLKCPGCEQCNSPLSLARNDNWLANAIRMFAKRPTMWALAEARGVAGLKTVALHDAVVKPENNNNTLDLSPVFKSVANGHYNLHIGGLEEQEAADASKPLQIEIANGHANPVSAPHIMKRGLYKVRITQDTDDTIGGESWILVTESSRYERDREEFDKATASAAALETDAKPGMVKQLLRAYLASMAGLDSK